MVQACEKLVKTGDKLTGVTNQVVTGDKPGSRRVTNRAETGDTGVTLTTIEPSIEPPMREACEIRSGRQA